MVLNIGSSLRHGFNVSVANGLFPRSSKRIITAGLRPTSNATYYYHDHQHNTCWI
jgi:guanyl-specific ribonuclease Sa